ncbi:MAG: HD domain-containing protein [Chloroflexota bacterium]
MDIIYRTKQFVRALTTRSLPVDAWIVIQAVLSPAEVALFRQHANVDRVHSFCVLQTLQAAGETDSRLLAAALLHDIGKCRLPPTLWDRVAGSLGDRFIPRRVQRWAEGGNGAWRRPFVIRCRHAEWGAQLAREAGSHPITVRLIRYHQSDGCPLRDDVERRLLQRLQWADDQN